jgi:uncharacterized short protein YbdD (DUF466 family)
MNATITTGRLRAALRHFWRQAVRSARLAIGIPDYDSYARHLRTHHPDRPVPTYEQFFTQCQEHRYRNGGTRGCC